MYRIWKRIRKSRCFRCCSSPCGISSREFRHQRLDAFASSRHRHDEFGLNRCRCCIRCAQTISACGVHSIITSNQSSEANRAIAGQLQRPCHHTLLWLISFSLGLRNRYHESINSCPHRNCCRRSADTLFCMAQPRVSQVLAGAFFVSAGIQFYLHLAKVSVPLLCTNLVLTPEVNRLRSIPHFIFFWVCLYFGFIKKP